MKQKKGLALTQILVILAVLLVVAGGGAIALFKAKPAEPNKILPLPTPTPTTVSQPATPSPISTEAIKMPWEDSVCGNGICERCESYRECCNYPCSIDPISGNQMCPPPSCLGWCAQDCPEE